MLRLVVGLGNPGRQYEKTRHNAGFWFVDKLVKQFDVKWLSEKRFNGQLASIELEGHRLYLLKPETFMNLSGQSLGNVIRFYQIKIEECLVVHDELDFLPGLARVKQGGGHAGHNGLKSIISTVGSNEFVRVRIGIGRPDGRQAVSDYVLSIPTVAERLKIDAAIDRVSANLVSLMKGEFELVMRDLHK